MRASPHASPDDIDIVSVWGSLRRSLRSIVMASLLAGALTYGVLSLMAPKYASEAQLAITAKGSAADPFRDPRREGSTPDAVAVRMDKEAINTHVRALLSPDLAQKVITALKLDTKPEFNSAAGSPDMLTSLLRMAGIGTPRKGQSDMDRTLASYFKQLEVFSPKESRSIVVKFTSIDPGLAKDAANLIAETYRSELAAQSKDESVKVENDLEPKITELKAEVASAEAEVERFKAEADILRAGAQAGSLNEQQLTELTAEVNKAKAARSEAEARARSAREMMKAGAADVSPDVQKSPHIQSLVQQRVRLEREIAEASASLLPGHPRMRQLASELAGLKKQISTEVAKVIDGLDKEAKIAALTEEAKTKSLNEAKSRVKTSAPDEVKLRSLEATASSKREELKTLQAKYESARVLAASQAVPVEAKIITQARASSIPVFPKKAPFALLAALGVFFLGTALSITKALIRGARQGSAAPVRRDEPMKTAPASRPEPSLPAVPVMAASDGGDKGASDRVHRMMTIGKVADHLTAHAPGAGGCRSLIVGETSAIDAGTEAIELVKVLAGRNMSTILIDWSPDGSGLAQKLGLSRTPGMTELLSGTAKFEDVVQSLSDSEAHFIACGAAQRYDTEGPDPDQLNLVLDALDEAYGHIVVVGPHDAARSLFEAIEGRFDAGITVTDGKRRVTVIQDPPGTFLGYEVADIELIRLDRKDASPVQGQRILRSTPSASAPAHPA